MKILNVKILKLAVCLLMPILLLSCSTQIGAWKNDKIKQSNHDELRKLNTQVLKCLKENDVKSLGAYLSKELLDDNYTVIRVQLASTELKKDSFVTFDDYYAVNEYLKADTIDNHNPGINNYRLVYPGTAEEMYISMFVPQNKLMPNKYMMTLVYAHFDYGWKLNDLTVGLYTINGKTSPELYELAKTEYKQNYLISAANTMTLAATCNRPNDIWQYANEGELYKFYQSTTNEANNKFTYPIILDKVSTKPRIVRIYNLTTAEGTYPNIIYITKISIKDIDAIKKENEEVQKAMPATLPGMVLNKKLITYSAYNEMPSSVKTVPHCDIKQVLE